MKQILQRLRAPSIRSCQLNRKHCLNLHQSLRCARKSLVKNRFLNEIACSKMNINWGKFTLEANFHYFIPNNRLFLIDILLIIDSRIVNLNAHWLLSKAHAIAYHIIIPCIRQRLGYALLRISNAWSTNTVIWPILVNRSM